MGRKTLTITCIATLALATAASSASAASKLWLVKRIPNTRAVVGESAVDQLTIVPRFGVNCTTQSGGTLLTNGKATDSLSFPTLESSNCTSEETGGPEPAYLLRGTIGKATLHADGTALLKATPSLIVAEPFWCVYSAGKLSGTFNTTFQPQTLVRGITTATLDKRLTLGASCAATESIEFRASISPSGGEGVYKAEIVG